MRRRTGIVITLWWISAGSLLAHDGSADFFRSIGKMYVVLGVVLLLFLGIVLFLVYLQRQVSKLEKQLNNER